MADKELDKLLAEALSLKRTCEHCAREFQACRLWQRFCTNSCRGRFHLQQAQDAVARHSKLLDAVQAENEKLIQENRELKARLDKFLNQG